jgi:hypothetical protein
MEPPALRTRRSPKPDHVEHHTPLEHFSTRPVGRFSAFQLLAIEPWLTRRRSRRADERRPQGRSVLTCSESGEGGIRTPDAGITDVTVFETAAFNHSATSPSQSVSTQPRPFNHTSPLQDRVPYPRTSISSLCRQSIIYFPTHVPRPTIQISRDISPANRRVFALGSDVWHSRPSNINHELQVWYVTSVGGGYSGEEGRGPRARFSGVLPGRFPEVPARNV